MKFSSENTTTLLALAISNTRHLAVEGVHRFWWVKKYIELAYVMSSYL